MACRFGLLWECLLPNRSNKYLCPVVRLLLLLLFASSSSSPPEFQINRVRIGSFHQSLHMKDEKYCDRFETVSGNVRKIQPLENINWMECIQVWRCPRWLHSLVNMITDIRLSTSYIYDFYIHQRLRCNAFELLQFVWSNAKIWEIRTAQAFERARSVAWKAYRLFDFRQITQSQLKKWGRRFCSLFSSSTEHCHLIHFHSIWWSRLSASDSIVFFYSFLLGFYSFFFAQNWLL